MPRALEHGGEAQLRVDRRARFINSIEGLDRVGAFLRILPELG